MQGLGLVGLLVVIAIILILWTRSTLQISSVNKNVRPRVVSYHLIGHPFAENHHARPGTCRIAGRDRDHPDSLDPLHLANLQRQQKRPPASCELSSNRSSIRGESSCKAWDLSDCWS